MIALTTIEAAIRTSWLLTVLQEIDSTAEVIFADPSGPRPTVVYASFRLLTIGGSRFADHRGPRESDDKTEFVKNRELIYSVNIFGSNAMGLAEHAKSRLIMPDVTDPLRLSGIAVYDSTIVTNLTALLTTDREARAQFDARFGAASSLVLDEGVIDTAVGRGEITGSGTTLHTVPFEA